jgi:hypothetical protein
MRSENFMDYPFLFIAAILPMISKITKPSGGHITRKIMSKMPKKMKFTIELITLKMFIGYSLLS